MFFSLLTYVSIGFIASLKKSLYKKTTAIKLALIGVVMLPEALAFAALAWQHLNGKQVRSIYNAQMFRF